MKNQRNRHIIFGGLLDFTSAVKTFNWGLIDFLVDVCVILTVIIWGCVHYPVLLKPFLIWVCVGVIVLFFLMAITIILRRTYTEWEDAKNQHYIERTKEFKNFNKSHKINISQKRGEEDDD